jgi:integrase
VGWTCGDCPTWDEPIRRVEVRGEVRFKATADATPRGVLPRRQTARVCPTLAQARAFVAEVRAVTEAGNVYGKAAPIEVVVDRHTETLDELCARWLESRVDVRQNTREGYARWLAPIRRKLGDRRVPELTIGEVRSLVAWLSRKGGRPKDSEPGKPLRATSVRDALKVLRMVLDMAHDEGLLPSNVARARSIKLPREPKGERPDTEAPVTLDHWPTAGDGEDATAPLLAKFRDYADQDALAGAWRLSLCGITRSEVLGLRWEDVDFASGEVTISRGHVPLDGGGHAVDDPKSASRYRTLPVEQMHPGTMKLLRTLRARQTEDRMAAGGAWQSSGFIRRGCPRQPARAAHLLGSLEAAVQGRRRARDRIAPGARHADSIVHFEACPNRRCRRNAGPYGRRFRGSLSPAGECGPNQGARARDHPSRVNAAVCVSEIL